MIARLVRGGQTVQLSINQIQSAYGYNTSITKIIDALICDKDRYSGGVHPSLYVSPLFCLICNVIHILLVYLSIFYVAYTRIISLEVSSGPKKISNRELRNRSSGWLFRPQNRVARI